MLNVGDNVPDFTLPLAYADGKKDATSFHQLLKAANGPVVIGFFPLAFTGVCTKEMCEMRDQQAVFDHVGAKAVGFSIDTPFTNVQFAKANHLTHPIFSDPNREVVNLIWATQTVAGVQNVSKRGWLVVGKDGKVAEKWVTDTPGEWSGIAPIDDALHKLAGHHH